MAAQERSTTGLRRWQLGAIYLLACAVIVSRRPDALLHAQFWAEDGHVWFADAYNFGWWAPLFRTQDGYFQVFPRLGASLALLVPFSLAPLALNLIAIAVQALPVDILLSSRSQAWGSLPCRALLAAVYLALPNSRELCAILTQSQWVLALCVFLLLTASTPKRGVARFFDFSILLLFGLTGPFCFFLLPIALFLAWKRPDGWRRATVGVLAALCLVQAWGLLIVNPSGRAHAALGASPALFARILAGHVFLATLLGENWLAALSSPRFLIFFVCVAIGGTALLAICFAKSTLEMKLFLLLSALLFGASLLSPAAYPPAGVTRWKLLAYAQGIRYWYFPTLAFAWSILWCSCSRIAILKTVSAFFLCIMCIGIVRDWRQPAYEDLHFAEYAKRMEAASAGTVVTIPENPEGWNLQLVKHSSGR